MDEAPVPAARPGGAVEPANRATVARQRTQTADAAPGPRYELWDPFAEATHHAKTFDEMVTKAERSGAERFQAIDAQGKRSLVHKVDGQWQRPKWLDQAAPAQPQRQPKPDAPARARSGKAAAPVVAPPAHEASAPGSVVPIKPAAARATPAPGRAEPADERAADVARLQAALSERYVIKRSLLRLGEVSVGQTEYRFKGDSARVAFTASNFRLATDTNSPSVARSMVDLAQARRWQALRVSGHEDFKRLVWLEASVRGVKTLGYEPAPADLELLRKEREARQINRIEPVADAPTARAGAVAATEAGAATSPKSGRGGGGRKAVLAALEAVLVDRGVPQKQRESVMAAAAEQLARRQAAGQTHRVKLYDKDAPVQRPPAMPTPEQQRARERATPAQVR